MFSLVGIWEYIQDVRETVHDLEQRLQRTKDNVEEIQTIMKSWTTPVLERKEGKKDTLLNLDDKTERLERTYGQIRTSGTKIHLLLKVCNDKSQWWSHQITTDRMTHFKGTAHPNISTPYKNYLFVLFQDNMSLFKADPSSAQWKVYVDYVDEMVIDGFFNATESSLKFFLENTGVLFNIF